MREMILKELFAMAEEEYKEFKQRHDKDRVKRGDLSTTKGDIFVGIDAGV